MTPDPYKYFRVEARELLDQLGQGTLALERDSATPDLVPRLLRLAHTLKGAARVVRQRGIADLAHEVEDALAPLRESPAAVSREIIDRVLELVDAISSRVAALVSPVDVDAVASRKPLPDDAVRTVRADIAEMDAVLDGIAETNTLVATLRRSVGVAERGRHLADLLVEQRARRRAHDEESPDDGAAAGKVRAMTEELRGICGELERSLVLTVDQMNRELRQVRDRVEHLRLVPAAALFATLDRTSRDVAQALGKHVAFDGQGGDMRLDAHVLGAVQGALVQVVRNAVAHGIEPESERRAAGKPIEGHVSLHVARRGRRVVFTCRDDGRGVDLDAVRQAAQRKGLLSPATQTLGAEELLRLLLRGGITTSGSVSELSGRGIGLDVVREVAERLGGEVTVRTAAGQWTTVELTVPLSLTSVEALVVESSGIVASIPLDAVQRSVRVTRDGVAMTAQQEYVLDDGSIVPFVSLSRLLQPGAVARNARSCSAVIVKGARGVAALGVDRLLGTANVVLRPLPQLAPASPVVAGASLDAQGNPQVVLDPDGLVAAAQRARPLEIETPSRRPPILVIDDSLTTRMLEQSILESAGFAVNVAASGEEALDAARRTRHALFLVDVEMPGMDGFTFIEHTRADPALRDVPSILVTSRSSLEDRRRGQDVGAEGYITKSEFDQKDLLDRISRLVG